MPTIPVSMPDDVYADLMARVDKTERKKVSPVVVAMLKSAAILDLESMKLIDDMQEKEKVARPVAINKLIKLGHTYLYSVLPSLRSR